MVREEEIVEEIVREKEIEEEIVSEEDLQESKPLVDRNPHVSSATENPQDEGIKMPVQRPTMFDPWGLAAVVLAVLIALLVLKVATPAGQTPKIWTPEELAKYNGTDESLPILVGILGRVFDVSSGKKHYGPGGGYNHFAGRDASRAFVSGNFTGDGLTNTLDGLTPLQVKSIDDWRIFFEKRYKYVGTVVGPFYDHDGEPTKEITKVAQQLALAEKIKQQQKEDEKRFPPCSSRYNADEGGEVWCETGYPRIVDTISEGQYKGTTGKRCGCFEKKYLGKKGLKRYDGCSPTAQKCRSAPPEVKQS